MSKPLRPIADWHRAPKTLSRIRRRYRAEKRFRAYGVIAIVFALAMLGLLFVSIVSQGYSAFRQTEIGFEVYFDPAVLDPQGSGDPAVIGAADYRSLVNDGFLALFPDVADKGKERNLLKLLSPAARYELRATAMNDPGLLGQRKTVWLLAASDVDMVVKGKIRRDIPEGERPVTDEAIGWIDRLAEMGALRTPFNWRFFSNADSRYPESAGIWGAVMGSFYTLLVTLALAFPIGVATAVYLEEFAKKNRFNDFIEVNINNLAAVPSIIFGLLGLAIFLQVFHLPRSAPVVGGLTLMLMTLPTIIIAARAALKAVPPSIREAAQGVGASQLQVVTHHVLPLAMPGILTGTIIGMAQALGETAPLLMIGMVAFIVDIPQGPFDPATALPVQVFLWADRPERGFLEKTSAAIMVLLAFLIAMNALAVFLRKRFERKW